MGTAGRAYVLCAAIAVTAMVSRTGWIDWQAVGHVATATLRVAAVLMTLVVLIVLAVLVVVVPVWIVTAVVSGLLKLLPARPTGEPPA